MLIFRYLVKEVFITLASLTSILMLIFMSNQFVAYLNRAASGQIPLTIVMKLMMLELPNLTGLLLPLGFYMALLIAYGRLYADSEMTVLQACGYGPNLLLKDSYIMAVVLSFFVLIIMLWLSPLIATERSKLLRSSGIQTLIKTVVPKHFTSISGGRDVFYVQSMNQNHSQANQVFLARQVDKQGSVEWKILTAKSAYPSQDEATGEDYLVLKEGHAYQGIPGKSAYQVIDFAEYRARLPHPNLNLKDDLRTTSSRELWPLFNEDAKKAAELQWRLSVPLMVLTLTLVAVPLSRVNPRSGKFARLLPAIIIYIVYANLMFVARNWVAAGKVAPWIGMAWIHLLVISLGAGLIFYNKRHLG